MLKNSNKRVFDAREENGLLLNGSSTSPFLFSAGLQFMPECIIDGLRYLNFLEMLLSFGFKI